MKYRESIKRIGNKLRGTAGESISETLVALLISALALAMLAGVIASASRIINKEKTKLEEYYGKNEAAVKQIATGEDGKAVIDIEDGKAVIDIEGTSDDPAAIPVTYYENDAFSTTNPVISYKLK